MPTVRFLPSEVEVELKDGETLASAARRSEVPFASVCGGLGSCGGCRVRIVEGEEHLSEMGPTERGRLGNTFFITKERLACQTSCSGPLVVEILLEQARDKRGRARRRALDRTMENAQRRADRQAERERTAERRRGRSHDETQSRESAGGGGNGRREPTAVANVSPVAASPRAPEPRPAESGEPSSPGSPPARRRRRRRRRPPNDTASQQ